MMLTISELPPPLSDCTINHGKFGRVATPRYKNWQKLAKGEIAPQLKAHQTIMIPVQVVYHVRRKFTKKGEPFKKNPDLDNLCKALGDILTTSRTIDDDSLIHDLRIRWASPGQKESVEIGVYLM